MNALRFSPRRFLSLLKKEAIEIFRDRSILFMGLALPLLMLSFTATAFPWIWKPCRLPWY